MTVLINYKSITV